jgi:hypothetical protein
MFPILQTLPMLLLAHAAISRVLDNWKRQGTMALN